MIYVSFLDPIVEKCEVGGCSLTAHCTYFIFSKEECSFYLYTRCLSHARKISDRLDFQVSAKFVLNILKDFIKKKKIYAIGSNKYTVQQILDLFNYQKNESIQIDKK